MTTLSVREVGVRVDGVSILDGVSFDAGPGDWVTVVGPNGAGKSTLLRSIAGAVASSGDITLGDLRLGDLRRKERSRQVAFVPQDPIVPEAMLVVDYVLLGRTPHVGFLGAETEHDLAVVAEVLERLDLAGFAHRVLETLSGGERQRAIIARALAQQTPVLLLDEPTSALDIAHQIEVLHLIDELRCVEQLTIVMTQHDLTLAGQFGDRVLVVHEGRVVADGPPKVALTVENLERFYGAEVDVLEGTSGPVIVPVRRR